MKNNDATLSRNIAEIRLALTGEQSDRRRLNLLTRRFTEHLLTLQQAQRHLVAGQMTVVVVADRHKLTGQSGEATGTTQAELDGGCGVPVNLLRIGQPDQEEDVDIKNGISNHGSIY